MAFGNSDGDFEMLEWTTTGEGPRFGALLHHTDGEREFAYDRASKVGKLDRGLDEAAASRLGADRHGARLGVGVPGRDLGHR